MSKPPPYKEPYACFVEHYLAIQDGTPRRPTVGQLMRSCHLSRATCKRFRRRYEEAQNVDGNIGENIARVSLTPPIAKTPCNACPPCDTL
jgi:hypothetical protein